MSSKRAWVCVYLLTAWIVTHFFVHFCGGIGNTLNQYKAANLDAMVDGRADRPYVGRMLVPLVMQGVETALPLRARRAVVAVAQSPYWIEEFDGGPVDFRTVIYPLLAFIMFFLTGLGGRAVFKIVYPTDSEILPEVAGILYLLAIPMWFRYIAYIYDPATLVLTTWLIYATIRGRARLVIPLFFLACVNKETAPLLLPFILYGLGKRTHPRTAFVLVLTAALVQLYRMLQFGDNPGRTLEFHLLDHQAVLWRYPMSVLWAFFVLGAFVFLARNGWKHKPKLLKLGAACTLVPLFLASLPFGYVDEIRALLDGYPFLAMLALPTFLGYLGLRASGGEEVSQLLVASRESDVQEPQRRAS